jgi:FkbM family methyltransferase
MLFLPSLKQNGRLDRMSLTMVFVGSRKLKELGESYDAWTSVFAPNLKIYGIDADETACAQMNAENDARKLTWFERHYPVGIWSGPGRQTLHITAFPGCSSLLPPREAYMTRHLTHQSMMRVVDTRPVEVTTLDAFCDAENVGPIDYLQVDVQGGGMEVLKGAERAVAGGVLALVSEADFVEAYDGAAHFGDLDVYLRRQGFQLFDLIGNQHGTRATFPINSKEHNGPLEWSDAFYFRDLIDKQYDGHPKRTPEALFKLACIADAMNFIDYAAELLEYLTLNYGASDPQYNFAREFVETLERVPTLRPDVLAQIPSYARMNKVLGRTPPPPATPGVYTISAPASNFGAGGNVIR